MKKKTTLKMVALLAILICSIAAPILIQILMVNASKASYDSDYMTVSGVLSTDSYVLFPFEKKNLTIGFSKYGEMIDYETKVGLNYNDDDPFAPGSSKVTEAQWVEGWIINVTYVEGGIYKNVWARATYSDYYGTGTEGIAGDWHEGATDGSTGLTVRGGRKTNGGAATDSIKVLYDGPRRFVALLRTVIYDNAQHSTALLNLTFTIVFNKAKKQVIVFKDIKRTDVGKNIGDMQVEFSNRGQWDLGDGTPPKSYAHFYEDETTVYNGHYQAWYNATGIPSNYNGTYDVCQIIDDELQYAAWVAHWPKPIIGWVGATQVEANRGVILASTSTKTQKQNGTDADNYITLDETPISYPQKNATGIFWKEEPMVFVSDQVKIINGTVTSTKVTYCEGNNTLYFPSGYIPGSTDIVKIVYKYSTEQDDMSAEPNSPFVIGEWAIKMYEATDQFRAVSVYGVTGLNDGEDYDCASHNENRLDSEAQYYLNETFNPYDLYDAVHKQEYRWVNITTLSSARSYYQLTTGLNDHIFYNLTSSAWSGYGISPETWYNSSALVESTWLNEFEDGIDAHSKNWALNLTGRDGFEMLMITPIADTPTSAAPLTLQLKDLVDFDFWYNPKSGSALGPYIEINATNTAKPGTATKYVTIQARSDNWETTAGWHHYTLNTIEDFIHTYTSDSAFQLADQYGTGNATGEFHSFEYWASKFADYYVHYVGVLIAPDCYALVDDLSVAYINRTSGIQYERVYNMEENKLIPCNWTDYCRFAEKVLINGTLAVPYIANLTFGYYNYTINFENGNITFVQTLSAGTHLKILYSTIEENEKGRYEWIIVGKDAATIDSLGAAYITEAFDSTKDIAVLMAGMDINATVYGPTAPFVMGGASSGTKADYRDSLSRSHLRDDWCGTIAISSSNMIFEGGPVAQLGTEYFNEFTDAFFTKSTYVTNNTGCAQPHSDKILSLSCWNKTVSGSTYAVIAVYKDLNGTIGLVIWGYDGQDTYYASKWFWDGLDGTSGIEYLQSVNRGVTAIVIKITYPTSDPLHPSVSVIERLGTITEKDQHDP